MSTAAVDNVRFPIGRFKLPEDTGAVARARALNYLEEFPARLRDLLQGMDDSDWGQTYKEGGWTALQITHHLADSILNAYVRIKLALSEDNPTIKTYKQEPWAELNDSTAGDPQWSLKILEGIHGRLTFLLRTLSEEDWHRTYFHPESKRNIPVYEALFLYEWHSKHHMEHIKRAALL